MDKVITKNLHGHRIKAQWGGGIILLDYYIKTETQSTPTNIVFNEYDVVCRIRGLEDGRYVELEIYEVKARTNNEDTLTADALADLLEWQCGTGVETELPEEKEVLHG